MDCALRIEDFEYRTEYNEPRSNLATHRFRIGYYELLIKDYTGLKSTLLFATTNKSRRQLQQPPQAP